MKVRGWSIKPDVSFSQLCVSLLVRGVEVGTALSPSARSPCESEGLLPPAAGGAGSRRHSAVSPLQNCLSENATLAKATAPFPGSLHSAAGNAALSTWPLAFAGNNSAGSFPLQSSTRSRPGPWLRPHLRSAPPSARPASLSFLPRVLIPGLTYRWGMSPMAGCPLLSMNLTLGEKEHRSLAGSWLLWHTDSIGHSLEAHLTNNTRKEAAPSSSHRCRKQIKEQRGRFWKTGREHVWNSGGVSGDHRRQDGSCLAHCLV